MQKRKHILNIRFTQSALFDHTESFKSKTEASTKNDLLWHAGSSLASLCQLPFVDGKAYRLYHTGLYNHMNQFLGINSNRKLCAVTIYKMYEKFPSAI